MTEAEGPVCAGKPWCKSVPSSRSITPIWLSCPIGGSRVRIQTKLEQPPRGESSSSFALAAKFTASGFKSRAVLEQFSANCARLVRAPKPWEVPAFIPVEEQSGWPVAIDVWPNKPLASLEDGLLAARQQSLVRTLIEPNGWLLPTPPSRCSTTT
ncbi:hypothetical protein M440DRAFT_280080 [Trichoderma longibrachiatum ATCC 18648]|uniref:Uncharacterized protein n=1 Tax=Trichoderma longibrachiatum ATCC 18648 TaxID=983965 RepID=A0A2T4C775_TRILO|nr:hypothetical protein M440DRAFT_280080 [Trichoderma longibrachiatum ATCC 18648]